MALTENEDGSMITNQVYDTNDKKFKIFTLCGLEFKYLIKRECPKILVHLHVYYHNQIDYFIKKMKSISNCSCDLYVTYIEDNEETKSKILKFKPDAHFVKVENRGYDVWPFIQVIQSVNLDNYDYIIKLHTKNKRKNSGFAWRNEVVGAILNSKKRFRKNLQILRKNSDIGMICSFANLSTVSKYSKWTEDNVLLDEELKNLKFKSTSKQFVAGTMFIARASIYKFLQNSYINAQKFAGPMSTDSSGTNAHVYERILSIAADEAGYKIKPVVTPSYCLFKYIVKNIFSIRNSNDKTRKIITLFGIKLKFKKKHNSVKD